MRFNFFNHRWLRRPVWLYAATAILVMAPLWSPRLIAHGEIYGIVSGIAEARSALHEGQFPLRVTPWQNGKVRYPLFQFYGNLQYTLGGLLHCLPGINAYVAFKITVFLALLASGCYLRRLARAVGANPAAALSAGLVCMTAPYLLTDLFARGAIAETLAFSLLPAAVFYTWRCFVRRGTGGIIKASLAWTAVALAHNITYLYGVVFAGLFILSFARPRRQFALRLARLVAAGGLHAMLAAWYFVPQFAVMSQLNISREMPSPAWSTALVPPGVLFWPISRTSPGSTTAGLGLQIGWPILVGAGASLLMFFKHSPGSRRSGMRLRLLVLFGIALFLVMSPVDVWAHLPRTFHYVQFTYRLLMFVVLWGSLLLACALTDGFPRRIPSWAGIMLTAALVLTGVSYIKPALRIPKHPRPTLRWIKAKPLMNGREDYLLATDSPTAATSPSPQTTPIDWPTLQPEVTQRGRWSSCSIDVAKPTRVVLPVLAYPGLMSVRVDGEAAAYGNTGRFVAIDVTPGRHTIEAAFTGKGWANGLSAIGAAIAILFCVTRLRLRR